MAKAREVPIKVVNLVHRAVHVLGQNRGEIRWSATKSRFVKANNRTLADEPEVLKYLNQHPDQLTWERAIKHIGPGVPRPPAMLPDTATTAQVDVDKLVARIDDYQAGTDRSVQAMLDQTHKVLDRLNPVEQALTALQQNLNQANRDVSANLDQIKDAMHQVEAHYLELKDQFGQTDQRLADAVAFDHEFSQKLDNLQQQLEDLQGLREEIARLQSEGVFNQALLTVDQPGIGEVVFITMVSFLVGVVVTMFALRSEGRWLDIPDIVWGIAAIIVTFLIFFITSWTTAEREEQVRVRGVS